MINKIYEHLKTKKKYNTLQLKYDVKCDELQGKIIELNTEKKVRIKQQELFEEKIEQLTTENIKLKEEIAELKKQLKNEKRRKNVS